MRACNAKLERAIDAIGGPVAVAYHMGRTTQWVYKIRRCGGINALADAIAFRELARAAGVSLSVDDLVLAGERGGPNGGGRRDNTEFSRTQASPLTSSRATSHDSQPAALAA